MSKTGYRVMRPYDVEDAYDLFRHLQGLNRQICQQKTKENYLKYKRIKEMIILEEAETLERVLVYFLQDKKDINFDKERDIATEKSVFDPKKRVEKSEKSLDGSN